MAIAYACVTLRFPVDRLQRVWSSPHFEVSTILCEMMKLLASQRPLAPRWLILSQQDAHQEKSFGLPAPRETRSTLMERH